MPKKPSIPMMTNFASSQTSVMGDYCNITRVTFVTGTYSDDEVSIRTGTFSVPCGFYFTNGQIKEAGLVKMVDYDAVLRIPTNQTIFITDEIELVEKCMVHVSGTFLPTEFPQIGATAQIIHLKRTK